MARKTRKAPLLAPDKVEAERDTGYRAGLYLRLSVESTEEFDGNSLGHQREICLDYLRDKPEILVWETYIDNGFSGTNFDRKAFRHMVSDLQAGIINCVVVKDLSRFGRNYLDVDEYLNEKFPAWGVRFISVLERFDTTAPSRESGFIVPFRNILNDYYARDISRKGKTAKHAKMQAGTFLHGGVATPYGYLIDRAHCTYQVDPETAPVVQRIFEMAAQGTKVPVIAKLLNQEGVIAPMKYRYLRGIIHAERFAESLWTVKQVRGILDNEAYLGIRVHRKTERTMGRVRTTAPEEQIRIIDAHQPLVTKELFDQVQAQARTRKHRQLSKNHTDRGCKL